MAPRSSQRDQIEHRGVTSILKMMGFIDYRWFTEEGRLRGQAIHQMVRDRETDPDFDPRELPVELLPWLDSYEGFRMNWPFELVHSEKWFAYPEADYGSKVDLIVDWRFSPSLTDGTDNKRTVVEIKAGGSYPADPIQTYAQKLSANANGVNVAFRGAVYLKKNGSPGAFHWHVEDAADRKAWGHCLGCYHWRKANRLDFMPE